MKRLFFLLLLLLWSIRTFAQGDTIQQVEIKKEFSREDSVREMSSRLVELFSGDRNTFLHQLERIEKECPGLETTFRIKLLWLIANGRFSEVQIDNNLMLRLSVFRQRVICRKNKKCNHTSFVPLNAEFDLSTKLIADSLLKVQKKGTDEEFLCRFYSGDIKVEKEIYNRRYKQTSIYRHAYEEVKERMDFGIEFSLGYETVRNMYNSEIPPFHTFTFKLGWSGRRNHFSLRITPLTKRPENFFFTTKGETFEVDTISSVLVSLNYGRELFFNDFFNCVVPYAGLSFVNVRYVHVDAAGPKELLNTAMLGIGLGCEFRWRMFTVFAEYQNRELFKSNLPDFMKENLSLGIRADIIGRYFSIAAF